MDINYALLLSLNGINLRHRLERFSRTGPGAFWEDVEAVSLDDPELSEKLAALKAEASRLDPAPFRAKLVLPADQIKYMTMHGTEYAGLPGAALVSRIEAVLEGATPYTMADLAYDYRVDGSALHIAAIARQTLREAEEFAVMHRFNPVSVVALPTAGQFPDEPIFGLTDYATEVLHLKRSDLPPPDPVLLAPHRLSDADRPAPVAAPQSAAIAAGRMLEAETPAAPAKEQGAKGAADIAPPETQERNAAPARPPEENRPAQQEMPATPEQTPEQTEAAPAEISEPAPSPATDARPDSHAKPITLPPLSVPQRPAKTATPAPARAAPVTPLLRAERAAGPAGPKGSSPRTSAAQAKPSTPLQQPAAPQATSRTINPRERDAPRFPALKAAILLLVLAGGGIWLWSLAGDGGAGPEVETAGVAEITPAQEQVDEGPLIPAPLAPAADMETAETTGPETAEEPADPAAGQVTALTDAETGDAGTGDTRTGDTGARAEETVDLSTIRPRARSRESDGTQEIPATQAAGQAAGQQEDVNRSDETAQAAQDIPVLPAVQAPPSGTAPADQGGASADMAQADESQPTPEASDSAEDVPVIAGEPPVTPDSIPERPGAEQAAGSDAAQQVAAIRPRMRPGSGTDTKTTETGTAGADADDGSDPAEDATEGAVTETGAAAENLTPEQVRLASIRPRLRPGDAEDAEDAEDDQTAEQSAIDVAGIAEALESAQETPEPATGLTTSLRPKPRPADFQQTAARQSQPSEPTRNQSSQPVPEIARAIAPRQPSASTVTGQATDKNALRLGNTNLIGVYGLPGNRRAYVRLEDGRYIKVQVGDRLEGGQVVAIGDDQLRYVKSGRNLVLRMPD